MRKAQLQELVRDLFSDEARQYPAAHDNWPHHIVEYQYEATYRNQFNSNSAIGMQAGNQATNPGQGEGNQGQTDAAGSSLAHSVNRPDLRWNGRASCGCVRVWDEHRGMMVCAPTLPSWPEIMAVAAGLAVPIMERPSGFEDGQDARPIRVARPLTEAELQARGEDICWHNGNADACDVCRQR